MLNVAYISASGIRYELDTARGPSLDVGGDLRGHAWEYELGTNSLRSAVSIAREAEFVLTAPFADADELLAVFAADVEAATPGRMVAGGWSQRAFVVASQPADVYRGEVALTMTALLLDGWWWREQSRTFPRGISAGGIDLPTDHDYDLGHDSGRAVLENSGLVPAPVRITYWGPCVDPYVIIGGNRYQVDASVSTGSTLVIDAMDAAKTVTLYDAAGNGSNAFSGVVREDGAMAFLPLPVGSNEVRWSGLFMFRVDWRERRVTSPWDL